MKNKTYEFSKNKNYHKSGNEYLWKLGCHECKKSFGEEERYTRIDVNITYMRGDDKVFCFHKGKCSKKGIQKAIQK